MDIQDLSISVRDKNLQLIGSLKPEFVDMTALLNHTGVGSWTIALPTEHPLASPLRIPGYGIQVLQRVNGVWSTLFSGPMTQPTHTRSPEDPEGLVTIGGVTDSILLADALAWGDPANAIGSQADSNDVRTGPAETIMKQYVRHNIGTFALSSRQSHLASFVTTATDTGAGPSMTKRPRFTNLLELLAGIAKYASMGFEIVQSGSSLVFRTYEIRDRTALVRFDIRNGSLVEETVSLGTPTTTRSIVGGKGSGVDRILIQRTTADSVTAEAQWGRKIESWIDQKDTDVTTELNQAGDEPLIEAGFTQVSVKAIPTDDTSMQFGKEWKLGDLVTVIVDGQETTSLITQAAFVANKDGVTVGASIGDVRGFKAVTSIESQVKGVNARVSQLERNIEINEAPVTGVSTATPNTLMGRDGAGRTAVAAGTAANDAVNKAQLDLKFGNIKRTVVTATSNFTPSPNALLTDVEVQGDGGAGGGRTAVANTISIGGGGGAGGYRRALITPAQIAAALSGGVIPVTIGAGGAPGTGATGGNGTGASFGTLVTATGGLGGVRTNGANTGAVVADGGAGGTSGGTATPDLVLDGAAGSDGRSPYNSALGGTTQFTFAIAGAGADSRFGQGGQSAIGASGFATAGRGYGSGGSGMYGMNQTAAGGGAGAPAIVIITEYLRD